MWIAVRDELVWIDCEMTGLDLGSDRLIEIAALVTDADLNVLGDGVSLASSPGSVRSLRVAHFANQGFGEIR